MVLNRCSVYNNVYNDLDYTFFKLINYEYLEHLLFVLNEFKSMIQR